MIEGHEAACLGALWTNGCDALDLTDLTADDFASPPNRLMFAATQRVGAHHGWVAVRDELKRRRQLTQVGGEARLIEISNYPHDAANVAYALSEVREASRQRRGIELESSYRPAQSRWMRHRRSWQNCISGAKHCRQSKMLLNSLGNRSYRRRRG